VGLDIFARRFDSAGMPASGDLLVNTELPPHQLFPAVAFQNERDFVVVWQSLAQDGEFFGVFGRRLNAPSSALYEVPALSGAGAGVLVFLLAAAALLLGRRLRRLSRADP
jgi:hypothetical protein